MMKYEATFYSRHICHKISSRDYKELNKIIFCKLQCIIKSEAVLTVFSVNLKMWKQRACLDWNQNQGVISNIH